MKKLFIIVAVLSLATLLGREGEHHQQPQHHPAQQQHHNNNMHHNEMHHNDFNHNQFNNYHHGSINPNLNAGQGGQGEVIVVPDDTGNDSPNNNQNPTTPQQ